MLSSAVFTYLLKSIAGGLALHALKAVQIVSFRGLVIPAMAVNCVSTGRLNFPEWLFPVS
jgi:hypothetical protein